MGADDIAPGLDLEMITGIFETIHPDCYSDRASTDIGIDYKYTSMLH